MTPLLLHEIQWPTYTSYYKSLGFNIVRKQWVQVGEKHSLPGSTVANLRLYCMQDHDLGPLCQSAMEGHLHQNMYTIICAPFHGLPSLSSISYYCTTPRETRWKFQCLFLGYFGVAKNSLHPENKLAIFGYNQI